MTQCPCSVNSGRDEANGGHAGELQADHPHRGPEGAAQHGQEAAEVLPAVPAAVPEGGPGRVGWDACRLATADRRKLNQMCKEKKLTGNLCTIAKNENSKEIGLQT